MAVTAHGQSVGKGANRLSQHVAKRGVLQSIGDDEQGHSTIMRAHPAQKAAPSQTKRGGGLVGGFGVVNRAACGVALMLGQVPQVVRIDRHPRWHVRPPAQGQPGADGEVQCVR